jgi:ammonia channel protein AmtB
MGALLMLMAFASLVVAGSQWWSAFAKVELTLPEQFRDRRSARIAMDTYVWNSGVPVKARRQYLRYMVFATVGLGLIAGAVLSRGNLLPAVLFAGVALLFAVQALQRWIKYRELL